METFAFHQVMIKKYIYKIFSAINRLNRKKTISNPDYIQTCTSISDSLVAGALFPTVRMKTPPGSLEVLSLLPSVVLVVTTPGSPPPLVTSEYSPETVGTSRFSSSMTVGSDVDTGCDPLKGCCCCCCCCCSCCWEGWLLWPLGLRIGWLRL